MTTITINTTNSGLIEEIKALVAKKPRGTTVRYDEPNVYRLSEAQ